MKTVHKSSTEFFIASAQNVKNICKPLFDNFPIHYFDYFRAYKDGSRLFLCSSQVWAEYLTNQKYWKSKNFKLQIPEGLKYYSWEEIKNSANSEDKALFEIKIKDAYNSFDLSHGIAITDYHNDYIDFYNFAAPKKEESIKEFYASHMDILKRFILYFRENAHDLIDESAQHKFIPTENHQEDSGALTQESSESICSTFCARKQIFSDQTEINRFYLPDNKTYLTKREAICLKLLSKGLLVKQIASQLNLSARSIEFYIRNIKVKLNFHRQSELITFVNNCDLFEVL